MNYKIIEQKKTTKLKERKESTNTVRSIENIHFEDKMKSYFNIFNNEIGKEKIAIKISYGDFIANKDNILFYIKDGFQFAIILDEEYLQNKNANILNVFKYVIIVDDKYLDGDVKGLHNIVKMI